MYMYVHYLIVGVHRDVIKMTFTIDIMVIFLY